MKSVANFILEEGFENVRDLLIGRTITSAPKSEYFGKIVEKDDDYIYLENGHKIPREDWGKCMIPNLRKQHARS